MQSYSVILASCIRLFWFYSVFGSLEKRKRTRWTMEDFPILEMVCLGSSVALSGLFYYIYRKKRKTVDKLNVSCDAKMTKQTSYKLLHEVLVITFGFGFVSNKVINLFLISGSSSNGTGWEVSWPFECHTREMSAVCGHWR